MTVAGPSRRQVRPKSSSCPPSSSVKLPAPERWRGRQHLHQDVRLGLGGAAVDQPWASISKSASSSVLPGLSPRGMSQPGFFFFFKSGSHFLPTFLTSGSLSGTFPEPSGFYHGHVSCLRAPHSQPGCCHPADARGSPRAQLPRPPAVRSHARPSRALGPWAPAGSPTAISGQIP